MIARDTRLGMVLALLLALISPGMAAAQNAGFAFLGVPYHGHTLHGAVWYPTAANPKPLAVGPYTMHVADGAPVAGHDLPLIVISHGNGGEMLGHNDTAIALAEAGFVVAAVTHDGDNYLDHSRELQLWERPPQISALIDAALTRWPGHTAIDPARIGMFGFSAGGFTTLVAIGGTPDFARIRPYCATHATYFVCTLQQSRAAPHDPASKIAWHADPRIRAAVIAAPALGFTFTKDALASVQIPVQLWAAERDHVLPVADNAAAVRDALPRAPDYHVVSASDHFVFISLCPPALAASGLPMCKDPAGFDRAGFHGKFNGEVVAFFQQTFTEARGETRAGDLRPAKAHPGFVESDNETIFHSPVSCT